MGEDHSTIDIHYNNMPSFAATPRNAFRFIPRHESNLIRELTQIVERRFQDSSPLEENSARTWTFSRFIYSYTNDVISSSLACAVLISFLISRHQTPTYVFVIWAISVVSYLMTATPEN